MLPAGSYRTNENYGYFEALIPTVTLSNHASCLLPLPNGDRLCVWFGGSDEGNADISIYQSKYSSKENKWNIARQITFDSDRSEQNPSLFKKNNGEIWLVYTAQLARKPEREELFNLQYTSEIRKKVSKDNGETWSDYEVLFSREGSFCRQPIQVLNSKRWVFPNWICFNDTSKNGTDITVVQISDDEGETWKEVEIPESQGLVHANIVEIDPGYLVALFRSRYADYIYRSVSDDNGDSWTVPERTSLKNNNSSISAIKLPSGRIAVAFNDFHVNDEKRTVIWPFERPSISVAVSDDGGITWPWKRIVEPGDGFYGTGNVRSNLRYEYPYLTLDSEGNVHITYSYRSRICIKHNMFTEGWIYGVYQEATGDCKLWK